jgi:hypothetical protein
VAREEPVQNRVLGALLVVVALCLASCQKLDRGPAAPKAPGPLKFDVAQFQDAIPLDYGTLVGVTQNSPGWVGLWFQRPDNTIVAAFVNIDEGRLYEKSLSIPRK